MNFSGTPFVIPKQAIVGTTPIVGNVTQVNVRRIVSYGLVTDGTVDGTWKIEASNDFALDKDVSMGNNVNAGTWHDVTAAFTQPGGAAVAVVAHGTVATQKQFVTWAPAGGLVLRVTFTPTAGAGNVSATIGGGSYS